MLKGIKNVNSLLKYIPEINFLTRCMVETVFLNGSLKTELLYLLYEQQKTRFQSG